MAVPAPSAHAGNKYEVTPLELFFDVVFVFAISQLSHHLLTHLSWRGAAETLVLLLPIFGVWMYASWSATMIRAEESRTHWLLFGIMLLSLFMNASVTRAFSVSGWGFVVPLQFILLGRPVWTIVNSSDKKLRAHYIRVLVWTLVAIPFWILGAVFNPDVRLICWALAAGIDLMGRLLMHPVPGRTFSSENVPFDADHMMERCRLFLIIALGETVFTTGLAIAKAPINLMTLVTGTFALTTTIALWSMAFGRTHALTLQHLEETRDPIRTSRYGVNAVMGMVAGLIALAVANEQVIAHPRGQTSIALSLLLGIGPVLFLVFQGWYLWAIPRGRSRLHWLGGLALLLVGAITHFVAPYGALLLIGSSLAILAILDRRG